MTLLAALIFGIATGVFVTDRQRRLWTTGIAVAVTLPVQSFVLPLFTKAGFSLSDPGYWGTQPFILALGLLISAGIGHFRDRRRREAHHAVA